MKKYTFEKVIDREKAKVTLDIFADCLLSLKKGEQYRMQMAEKFIDYGNIICIKMKEEVVGFGAFYDNNQEQKEAFLSMIAVKDEYRDLGVGSMLLHEILLQVKKKGMKSVKLEVLKNNGRAIDFYKGKGFVNTGETEKSYIMCANLEHYQNMLK